MIYVLQSTSFPMPESSEREPQSHVPARPKQGSRVKKASQVGKAAGGALTPIQRLQPVTLCRSTGPERPDLSVQEKLEVPVSPS